MINKIKSLVTGEQGLAMVIGIGFMAVSIPILTGAIHPMPITARALLKDGNTVNVTADFIISN